MTTIAVTYLTAHAGLVDLVHGRVYGPDSPEGVVLPFVKVTRVAGRPEPGDPAGYLDHADLQLEAYAETRDEAFTVCAMVVGALHEIPQITALGIVTAVQDLIGPRKVPDSETKAFRYLAEVLVTAHPLP
jgi:hypothetical protein